jgi:glycosyltransferase involved in cell wall biosynthesis
LGLGFSSKDLIILSVGRLTAAKRPLELIRTFSIVAKGVPNAKLIMVGGGELTDEAKRLANALCPNNIQVLGYVPDNMILKLYPSADYFIIASKYEGQPLTLLEAMSSGLPCIVSEIPNLSMVAEAKCGLVTDFTEIHKAAAAILQYIQQDNSEHARNAREYVLENHDWSIIVQRYIEEFNRIARH